MNRIIRRVRQAGVYFVTSSTEERRSVFANHECARVLLEQLLACRDRGFYSLHGFVIMPDHFHALLTPGMDTSLEKAMMMIKGGSSRRLKEEGVYRLPVWQKSFHDRWIRDAVEFKARMNYMASNPVAPHLVESPADYPWSSATGKFAMDASAFDGAPQSKTFSG